MWGKARRQVGVELEELRSLTDAYRALIAKCQTMPPDIVEISALAAMLHSFYSGVENVFKRITVEIGDTLPQGDAWHQQLLDSMADATKLRPAVVSPALRDALGRYLDFRHVFRHVYLFHIEWDRMSGLVFGCEETFRQLESELKAFFDKEPR